MERYTQLQGIVPNKQYKKQLMNTSGRISLYEDYVSFETAKLLKEKGFKEWCLKAYWPNGSICNQAFSNAKEITAYSRPTLQMVNKWLRKMHNINPVPYALSLGWAFDIFDLSNRDITGCKKLYSMDFPSKSEVFSTYEEASEAAIKYCLENLI